MVEKPTVRAVLDAAVHELGGQERPGQVTMAETVAETMTSRRHLLVQAGTGTGKSLGYLVPAMLHDDRVVVRLIDQAVAFDPFEMSVADTTSALEDRPIGGLGIHFVRTLIDEVSYSRDDDSNVITLTLLFPPQPATAADA